MKILLNITKDVEHIRLHMRDLNILKTLVTTSNGTEHNVTVSTQILYGNDFFMVEEEKSIFL